MPATDDDTGTGPLSLYIHVPFCTVKCAYCDFNSYAGLEPLTGDWLGAALRELELWSAHTTRQAVGREIATVFIGGGTPSLLEGEQVARLLEAARRCFAVAPDAEITLEANPESVRVERMRDYRVAGVNRVSMGVQSLDADELRFLDRLHSAERAEQALSEIRAAGFDNVNLDLIYGLPRQRFETWRSTLERVAAWRPEHLSCYALTVEEGTPLAARVAAGAVVEADPDVVAEISAWTARRLSEAGYAHYETSNYALPGRECRHNLNYWRCGDYIGVGPGAHGCFEGLRYSVARRPAAYIRKLASGGSGPSGLPSPAIEAVEPITESDALVDALTLGLRLAEGVDEEALKRRYPDAYARVEGVVEWAVGAALAERRAGRLRLTERGHGVANEVFVRLVEPSLLPSASVGPVS